MRSTLEDLQRMTGGVRIVTMETGPPVLAMPYDAAGLSICAVRASRLLCLPLDPDADRHRNIDPSPGRARAKP